MSLRTEFSFTLPKGYLDPEGGLHRDGVMRLATARDEVEPLRDPRVRENEAYLDLIVLSRVVTSLGSVSSITPRTMEQLFASDLTFLQELYHVVNFGDPSVLDQLEPGHPFPQEAVAVG